ncbi:hypothetical protein PFISCL1PPCAC_13119, partial [Pristionchus fissidentatus]
TPWQRTKSWDGFAPHCVVEPGEAAARQRVFHPASSEAREADMRDRSHPFRLDTCRFRSDRHNVGFVIDDRIRCMLCTRPSRDWHCSLYP